MDDKKFVFSLSLLCFWIKGSLTITHRDIQASAANAILGIIPVGKKTQNIPLRNVSDTGLDTKLKLVSLIIGGLIILRALPSFTEVNQILNGIIGLIIGVPIFLCGFQTRLTIQRAGDDYYIQVPFYERKKMEEVQVAIRQALDYEADKGDMNKQKDSWSEAIGQSVVNALNSQTSGNQPSDNNNDLRQV